MSAVQKVVKEVDKEVRAGVSKLLFTSCLLPCRGSAACTAASPAGRGSRSGSSQPGGG